MDDRQFRTAMGKFPTGVTVIATDVDGDLHGMTANAFMSVSLSPKLVVISIGEKARILRENKRKPILFSQYISCGPARAFYDFCRTNKRAS